MVAMIYEATLQSVYFDQKCINRWNYFSNSTPAAVSGSFALAKAMGFIPEGTPITIPADSVFAKLRPLTSDQVQFTQVIVKALYSVTDFYTTAISSNFDNGTNTGAAASPALAYGFTSSRVRQDIDRGTKRFVGVVEENTEAGGVLVQGALDLMNALATAMSAVITYTDEGQPVTFTPVICKKQKYTTPKGTEAYRYFPTLAEQQAQLATSIIWSPMTDVRTQTSRQYKR